MFPNGGCAALISSRQRQASVWNVTPCLPPAWADPSCLRGTGLVTGGQKETADRHKSQGHPDLELSPAFKGLGTDSRSLRLVSQGDEGSCYFCPEPCSNPWALLEDIELIAEIIHCCCRASCMLTQRTCRLRISCTLIYFVRKSREFSPLWSNGAQLILSTFPCVITLWSVSFFT